MKNEPKSSNLPVTQVSYNYAMAYCKWSGSRLPTYDEYWELIKDDNRKVITNIKAPISEVEHVNIIGSVWELTNTFKGNEIRLAGVSLFCSQNTCHQIHYKLGLNQKSTRVRRRMIRQLTPNPPQEEQTTILKTIHYKQKLRIYFPFLTFLEDEKNCLSIF